jgi:RimJ/RimL family protein N-acetyltransferase
MEVISLRQWRDADLPFYVAMNADPQVMHYFPSVLTPEQSEASLIRQRKLLDERGWGLWVVDVDGEFAGFTGLSVPTFEALFMPCVEVGWRLRREFWGRGIACRAAARALEFGFQVLKLSEIVSFTAAVNTPSRRLMERLGMVRDIENDFDHPAIAVGHQLRQHVLYRLPAPRAGAGEVVSTQKM